MYEILIEKAAESDLKKLPAAGFERIIPHLKGLAEEARPAGSRKIKRIRPMVIRMGLSGYEGDPSRS